MNGQESCPALGSSHDGQRHTADQRSVPGAAPGPGRPSPPPRTWLVAGDKLGDNAQARMVCDGLGWAVETRRLTFQERWRLGKPPFEASLHHVDLESSDALAPPWPDLVITVGRRPAMVALWIQEQSGGQTRVVLLGRPKRWLNRFALVVAPSQYGLPRRSNVLPLRFPLMRADAGALEQARAAWRDRLQALPRPLTAVLVGGQTKPFRFDAAEARHMLDLIAASTRGDGGSLYVTTSRRTPQDVVNALRDAMPVDATLHTWSVGGGENPYLGLLAHADRFVVTGDSVSMLMEVARLGRPLAIHALPLQRCPLQRARHAANRLLYDTTGSPSSFGRLLFGLGLPHSSRDLTRIHAALTAAGSARPLGEGFAGAPGAVPDETPLVVERIRKLCS